MPTHAKASRSRSAKGRNAILAKAAKGGNVAKVCREASITRQTLYNWRKRYEDGGLERLKDRRPGSRNHPNKAPVALAARVEQLAVLRPELGRLRLWRALGAGWRDQIHPATVREILRRAGLLHRDERYWRCHEHHRNRFAELPEYRLREIERMNPCVKEEARSDAGSFWILSTYQLQVADLRPQLVRIAVDHYSLYAVAGELHANPEDGPQHAIELVRNTVFPFFLSHSMADTLWVKVNDRDHIDAWRDYSHYSIGQRWARLSGAYRGYRIGEKEIVFSYFEGNYRDGFHERFADVLRTRFLAVMKRRRIGSIGELDGAFRRWLRRYNATHRFRGFPNWNLTPSERLKEYAESNAGRLT